MDTEAPIQVGQLNINNRNFPVYQGVNTIGRNRQAIINVIHMNISQNHAIIVTLQDTHYISDLKSSNGTFVDGTKLKPFKLYPLTHSANIVLGTLYGTYICKGDFSSTTNLNTSLTTQSFYDKKTQLLEVTQSMDLHDAPTQRISWAKPVGNFKELPAVPKTIFKESVGADNISLTLTKINQCNDEGLLLLTNDDNLIEPDTVTKLNEEDEETEVLAIERPSRPVFVEEDNELTDCEEDGKFSKALTSVEHQALKEDSNESLQFLNSDNSSPKTEIENDCNINNFNGSSSFIASQTAQKNPEQHSSEDSDSPIVARTVRKCSHIISSEDFFDSNNIKKSSAEKEHKVLANESMSKTQSYNVSVSAAESNLADVSIPETQDKSWWNDSDCIPPTQDVFEPPKTDLKNRGKSSQLSEENFKLGLTQLMDSSANESSKNIEDSFLAATQKIVLGVFTSTVKMHSQQKADYQIQKTCDNSPKAENIIVQKTTHSVLGELTNQVITESNTAGHEDDDTQKLATDVFQVLDHTSALDISTLHEVSIYDIATQKVSSEDYVNTTQKVICSPNTNPICDDKDIYDAPSQKVPSDMFVKPTQEMPLSTLESEKDILETSIQTVVKCTVLPFNDDANVDNVAAQKLSSDIFTKPTQRICQNIIESDEDFFTAPTQKVIFKPNVTLMQDDEEVYNATTQKVFPDISIKATQELSTIEFDKDALEAPTQTVAFKSNVTPLDDEEGVFNEATQRVSSEVFMKPTQKKSFIESDKDIFEAPKIDDEENMYDATTQKIPLRTSESYENDDNIFDAPTQKVPLFKTGMLFIHNNEAVCDTPNQKICESQKVDKDTSAHKSDISSVVNLREDEYIYDSPTQNISRSVEILRQKNDETFLAPIPKISTCRKSTKLDGESCTKPAQNSASNSAGEREELDVRLVPSQNAVTGDADKIKEVELKRDGNLSLTRDAKYQEEDELRVVKDPRFQNDDHKVSSANGDPFSKARIEDSVQKSVDPSNEVELQTEKKKLKRSFSFKKTPCNLNASLSILSNEPKVTVKSLLVETASESSNTRPHCLENLTTNSSHWEVNQSMALAESKLSKTRKITKGPKITVSVPKDRQSLTIAKPKAIEEEIKERPKKGRTARKPSEVKPVREKTRKQEHIDDEGGVARRLIRRKIAKSEIEDGQVVTKELHEKAKNAKDNLEPRSSRQSLKRTNAVKSSNRNETSLEYITLVRQTSKRSKITSQDESHGSSLERDTSCKQENALEDTMKKGRRKRKKSTVEEQSVIAASPPKKLKTQGMPNTPQRGSRRQKPKVVFTMLESPLLESLIKQLGGTMVFSIETCSVLVTEHVKRSQKLLEAIGLGRPICSPKWITDSKKNHEFLDPWDYILTDPEAEQKWDFSLRESLNRSRVKKLFNSYSFHIQVTAGVDVLKGTIEACGGKCLPKIPSRLLENAYVISLKENQTRYSRVVKKHPHFKVIEPEAVFDAALRQELRFSRHILT